MSKELLVFDLDGTLIDSKSAFARAMMDYSAQNGLPEPHMPSIYRGYADPDSYDFGWGVDRPAQMGHFLKAVYMFDNPAMPEYSIYAPALFSRVRETLEELKGQGHALAVVTSRPLNAAAYILEANGIKDCFSAVRTYDDVAKLGLKDKPAPDMLVDVMQELGAQAETTFMIGDTVMDVCMAVAAKTRAVAVSWGYHAPDELLENGAHHMLEHDVSELVAVLSGTR